MAVQNSLNAVAQALEEGMAIQKLHLVATSDADPDRQLEFTLDAGLAVSSLKLPKAEKGAEEDATLLINADAESAHGWRIWWRGWLQPEEVSDEATGEFFCPVARTNTI